MNVSLNSILVVFAVILLLLLVVFLIYQNMRSNKKYEENLNSDFEKSKKEVDKNEINSNQN